MAEARYLIEKFKDEHNTLSQTIETDLYLNELTDGMVYRWNHSKINPNLTIMYEQIYTDNNFKPLKIERLVNDEWVEIENKEK